MSAKINPRARTWAEPRKPDQEDPRIKTSEPVSLWQGKWLSLWNKPFTDRLGHKGEWTFVRRVAGHQAVAVIAHTEETGSLVLIRQYRIPLDAWVWEFPAGLVDEGESLESTAIRELKEETGYEGRVIRVSPPGVSSPGMATEEINLVHMTCSEAPGDHERESSEAIEVHLLDPHDAGEFVAFAGANSQAMDAKLLAYLLATS